MYKMTDRLTKLVHCQNFLGVDIYLVKFKFTHGMFIVTDLLLTKQALYNTARSSQLAVPCGPSTISSYDKTCFSRCVF